MAINRYCTLVAFESCRIVLWVPCYIDRTKHSAAGVCYFNSSGTLYFMLTGLIRFTRVSFQPIKMTGSCMYMTGSWKEATLHKADIWTILGKNN